MDDFKLHILSLFVDPQEESPGEFTRYYTLHGHKLRLFTRREAQFVTGAII